MLNSLESLISLLEGTLLQGQQVIQFEIPESQESAFAIEVKPNQDLAAWNFMRDRLELTQRYPVLVYPWFSHPQGWKQGVIDQDFCSRFYYKEEVFQGEHQNSAPEAIISRVPQVDLAAFLSHQMTLWQEDLEAEVDYALEETKRHFGVAPDKSEIEQLLQAQVINSQFELERWLFNWEDQNCNPEQTNVPMDLSYLDWFEPHADKILILLPTGNSWESLAYLHWFGACSASSEVAIHFLQRWHQQYAAELVCHYGTMLQFQVNSPPSTRETAFELAWEQYALAPYTLQGPGVSLRDHSRSLLSLNRWFLHERP